MDTNVIYCGDNIEVMKHYIRDDSIDLIYADPPFFSNKQYEVIWGDGYELRSFEDRWKGGINNYIAWMEPRLRECHRILKKTGSIFLHCDWHAGHYLKKAMDDIFDYNNFANEIVWCYSHGGKSKRHLGRKHDTIFWYGKTEEYFFNPEAVRFPMRSGSVSFGGKLRTDKDGRKYRLVYGTKDAKGKTKYYKYYLDKGKIPEDWWTDINSIQSGDIERLGYPTQKPIALLERIIRIASNPMEIMLDPFCGCGTSIVAAHNLGRQWIGIDVSPTACKLMAKRMRSIGMKEVKIIGLPKTIEELKALAPFEFQNWVFEKLRGRVNPRKVGDLGVDGWIELDVPTQVKQSENVGRTTVDRFETAIQRYGKKQGVIVAFSFTKDAYDEVARVHLLDGLNKLEIKLKTVEEILKET